MSAKQEFIHAFESNLSVCAYAFKGKGGTIDPGEQSRLIKAESRAELRARLKASGLSESKKKPGLWLPFPA